MTAQVNQTGDPEARAKGVVQSWCTRATLLNGRARSLQLRATGTLKNVTVIPYMRRIERIFP